MRQSKRQKKKQPNLNYESFEITYNIQDAEDIDSKFWKIGEKIEVQVQTEKVCGMHDKAEIEFLKLKNFKDKHVNGRLHITTVGYI